MTKGGLRPGGGTNLRALAISAVKTKLDLYVITNYAGQKVLAPGNDFDDFTAALTQLAGIKYLGVPNIRYIRRKLALAFELFKKPAQQTHLNVIVALVDRAEELCKQRAEKRADKRALKKIVAESKPTKPAPAPAPVADSSIWD
jgi:hypothetical protein